MKIVSRAPVRIDPAGGGTDAPPYSIEYGGTVVNFAVARYSYAYFQTLPKGSGATIFSRDLNQGMHVPSVSDLKIDGQMDFLKAFPRRLLKDQSDFVLVTESEVPVRTGLGGSGALGVAVTKAITHATGKELSQFEIALLANEVERGDLGYAGGNQDSIGSAVGGAKMISYHQGGGCSCEKIEISKKMRAQIERDLLLIYTGGIHLSGGIHADIKAAYEMENSPVIAAMDGLKEAAQQMAKALEQDDSDGFIGAMNDSRRNHYALHFSCDSDVLREYFSKLDPHILGGKTSGAGGGGFVFVYAKPGHRKQCIEIAESLGGEVWPYKMDLDGAISWEENGFTESEIEEIVRRASALAENA